MLLETCREAKECLHVPCICDEDPVDYSLHDEPPWDGAAKLTVLLGAVAFTALCYGAFKLGGVIVRAVAEYPL